MLRAFTLDFVTNRKRDIVKADVVNTSALLNSVYGKNHVDVERNIYMSTIFLKSYGRYTDMRMRYTRAGGEEMIEDLKDWAKTEGTSKFRQHTAIRKAGKNRPISDERVAEIVAWGIVRRLKNKGTNRRKSWWNKGKTRDIENFYDTLLLRWPEAVAKESAEKIEGK